jgi:hypothetical protein
MAARQVKPHTVEKINACQTAGELAIAIRGFAKSKDEDAMQAILWGHLLLAGSKQSGAEARKGELYRIAWGAANAPARKVGTRALQVWWLEAVGLPNAVPDLRDAAVKRYGTVISNGKPKRVPIYHSPKQDLALSRVQIEAKALESNESKDDALLLFRWWTAPSSRVPEAHVVSVAHDEKSPFRELAIGELSLRERLAGAPGVWSRKWRKISDGSPSVAIRSELARQRDRLRPVR